MTDSHLPYRRTFSPPIRVGLIGYGVAGSVFHAPLIAANPDYRLDAIVTAGPLRAAHARYRHPQATILQDSQALWDIADQLDLAVIASPTPTHADLARAALKAGLGVVVDKPFAVTAEEGRDLIATAAEARLPFQVFQNRRWDGDFRTLRRLLDDNALGAVHRFESRFEWWKPTRSPSWKDSTTHAAGAGLAYDLGTHLIDQAIQLFGPVADVHAELDARRPNATNDDDTFIALRHHNGTRSHLWMSCLTADPGPRFRLLGDRATFTKYGLDPQEAGLAAGDGPGTELYGFEPDEQWGTLSIGTETTAVRPERGDYPAFYRELAQALQFGAPLPVDSAGPLAVLEILEDLTVTGTSAYTRP